MRAPCSFHPYRLELCGARFCGCVRSLFLGISYRELQSRKDPDESIRDEIVGSKDPSVFTVFLEDCAGLVGTFLAFAGIFIGQLSGNPYLDPITSILVGVLLASVAVLLGRESGALLVGERTNRGRIKRIKEIIQKDDSVDDVGSLLTMQLGPREVLLALDIRFRHGLDVRELELAIDRIEESISRREADNCENFRRSRLAQASRKIPGATCSRLRMDESEIIPGVLAGKLRANEFWGCQCCLSSTNNSQPWRHLRIPIT